MTLKWWVGTCQTIWISYDRVTRWMKGIQRNLDYYRTFDKDMTISKAN